MGSQQASNQGRIDLCIVVIFWSDIITDRLRIRNIAKNVYQNVVRVDFHYFNQSQLIAFVLFKHFVISFDELARVVQITQNGGIHGVKRVTVYVTIVVVEVRLVRIGRLSPVL